MIKFYVMATEYVRSLREREDGQALVEYALILALVSVLAIGALKVIGDSTNDSLKQVGTALTTK